MAAQVFANEFLDLVVQESQDALSLKQLLNEAHIAGDLKILILLYTEAEHDRGSLLEVLPEFRIFALGKQILQDVGIGGGSVLWSGGCLAEAIGDGQRGLETLGQLVHLGAGIGGCFLLHCSEIC